MKHKGTRQNLENRQENERDMQEKEERKVKRDRRTVYKPQNKEHLSRCKKLKKTLTKGNKFQR